MHKTSAVPIKVKFVQSTWKQQLPVGVEFCRFQTFLRWGGSWQCSPEDPEIPPMTAQTLGTPEGVQTLPLPFPWNQKDHSKYSITLLFSSFHIVAIHRLLQTSRKSLVLMMVKMVKEIRTFAKVNCKKAQMVKLNLSWPSRGHALIYLAVSGFFF